MASLPLLFLLGFFDHRATHSIFFVGGVSGGQIMFLSTGNTPKVKRRLINMSVFQSIVSGHERAVFTLAPRCVNLTNLTLLHAGQKKTRKSE